MSICATLFASVSAIPMRWCIAAICMACCSGPARIIRHGKNWKLWVLCDRDPVERWIDGRVALLGDAAHPMLQYFAQGACMVL